MSREFGVRSSESGGRRNRGECLIRLVNYQVLKIENLGFL
jgi:hypothetical protein